MGAYVCVAAGVVGSGYKGQRGPFFLVVSLSLLHIISYQSIISKALNVKSCVVDRHSALLYSIPLRCTALYQLIRDEEDDEENNQKKSRAGHSGFLENMLPAMVLADWEGESWTMWETRACSVVEKQPFVVQQPFGFMDLPGEIRNMIYANLLISPDEDRCGLASSSATTSSFGPPLDSAKEQRAAESANEYAPTSSIDENEDGATTTPGKPKAEEREPRHLYPAILATSRRINAEATPLFYALNTFTATITNSAVKTTHAPPLLDVSHPHLHHTRSWTIVIDLAASTPDGWRVPEWDWQDTIDQGREIVDGIKKRVRRACLVLNHLEGLHKVRIEVVSDHGWELRSRLGGVGMVQLLEEFKKVTVKDVEIEGAGLVVPKKKISNVRKAMRGLWIRRLWRLLIVVVRGGGF